MNIQHHRVREYAYQIWESEGKPEGQDQRHWDVACKLASGDGSGNPADFAPSMDGTVVFEDHLDQSPIPHIVATEPLTQLNPDHPLHATEPAKSLIDTGPIVELVIVVDLGAAQVKNIDPPKTAKPRKSKLSQNQSENEVS